MNTAPVIALVGRPNVGKSTLFNQLTRSRDALVADQPGLTRDRQYGFAKLGDGHCVVVDTGGIIEAAQGLDAAVLAQSRQAIIDADLILFMVDARAGLVAADSNIAQSLREHAAKTQLVVNKCEGLDISVCAAEFYPLGLGDPLPVAAAHGQGMGNLRDLLMARVELVATEPPRPEHDRIAVALVGRPNAGKSTLLNRLVGEERVIASDVAGTTRDSVEVAFERDGKRYTLIDTAGLRRKSKVSEKLEKFSIIKTLQSIEACNVVVALLDGQDGIGAQDARILGLVADSGRAIVIALNKWDGLDSEARKRLRSEIDRKFPFLDYATVVPISALHGSGLRPLLSAVQGAHKAAVADLPTPALSKVLESAVAAHSPPSVGGRRVKLRYAHQGGRNPPTIVIHGNQTDKVTKNYQRYLINAFREAFKLHGTPLQLEFRTGENPYKDRKNVLNVRQLKKRERMIKHRKKG